MPDWGVDLFRPALGSSRLALVVVVVAAAAAWLYVFRQRDAGPWRRGVLMALRLIAVAVLAVVLMGPSAFVGRSTRLVRVPVSFLADSSASMAERDVTLPGGDAAVSRWDAIAHTWLDPDYLKRLGEVADVRLFRFDSDVGPLPLPASGFVPAGKSTDLFGALDKVLRAAGASDQGPPGLALMLSDGHDTKRQSDPGLTGRLYRQGWPVFTVPVGSGERRPDVALMAWADADFLLDGQSTTIHAALTQWGFDGRQATVDLLLEGRLVESRKVRLGDPAAQDAKTAPGSTSVAFTVKPAAAPGRPVSVQGYEVVVHPLEGQAHTDNNHRWVFLQVSRQRIRVAMFEAQPYWDTKFLAQTLRDDPRIELTTVFGLGEGRTVITRSDLPERQGPALTLPVTQAQLNGFDVVILGKGVEQFFGGAQATMLVNFVRQRGGALVLARGEPFDPAARGGEEAQAILAPIEPVRWGIDVVGGLKLELAPAGRRSPLLDLDAPEPPDAVLTRLPDMIAATRIDREKAASIVLLTQSPRNPPADAPGTPQENPGPQGAAGMAAVAHQNAGAGQVLAVLTDGMWRWAFLPGTLRRYDSVYQQFWSRAIRWLAAGGQFLPGQSVAMTLDRLSVEPGDPVAVTVTTRFVGAADFHPTLRLIAPDGSAKDVPMAQGAEQSPRLVGTVRPEQPGVYVVELDTPGMDPDRITTRLAVYDQSAERSDTTARPQTLAALAAATGGQCLGLGDREKLLDHLRALQLARVSDRKVDYVFNRPLVLAVLLGALGLEWLLRRRAGLL